MRGAAPALLRARSSDPEPGTLLGRIGKEAGRYGRIDAATAMAAGRPLAGVSGSDLGAVGAAGRQERWDAGNDYVGARRKRVGMEPADRGGGRGITFGRDRRSRGAAHLE